MRTRTLEVPQVANLFFKFGALLFVVIICANGAAAQTYRGTIHGVVTDPSGAVVVAARGSDLPLDRGQGWAS